MIESIKIKKIATYPEQEQELASLSEFNYFYGPNGSGKTTVSRVIADASKFTGKASLQWKNNHPLKVLVYNSDFIENNLKQSEKVKGVFTLGEIEAGVVKQIDELKKHEKDLIEKKGQRTKTLKGDKDDEVGGKQKEFNDLNSGFIDTCWKQKGKYDNEFKDAFAGARNSKDSFRDRVISEKDKNSSTLQTLEHLKAQAKILFSKQPTARPLSANPLTDEIIDEIQKIETDSILAKKIIGASDVDIAGVINSLGISDWVKEGIPHFEALGKEKCPFCQQGVKLDLPAKFELYFNVTFEEDLRKVKEVLNNYELKLNSVYKSVEGFILGHDNPDEAKELQQNNQLLKSKIDTNILKLKNKVSQPSSSVVLEDTETVLKAIKDVAEKMREDVTKHNKIVGNFSTEKDKLVGEVWRFILDTELKEDIENYQKKKTETSTAIQSLSSQITDLEKEIRQAQVKITELEKNSKSIEPTVTEINRVLTKFGFSGFKLQASKEKMHYAIIRSDGTTVGNTLSEGEKTFIAFLYFYHLLNGSHDENDGGINSDRIVVFDDPVSSLDSSILFIVSSLIRELIEKIRSKKSIVKQVFVLTHNIYFHKEVTFNMKRKNDKALREETFWIIKKVDNSTVVEFHDGNPIKTSYELLWKQVQSEKKCSLTIQNTLRRILENYFKIMGNTNLDSLAEKFDGKEQFICKSLLSWINDGSHYSPDDLYISGDEATVEIYLNVFKEIFHKAGHHAHYDMMMGEVA